MIHVHAERILEHLDSIRAEDARKAYLYLTHHAATLRDYDCRPQDKGAVRDFRYYRGTEQPFAFIVNQSSLLWYFRLPSLHHPAANLSRLREQFSEVKENNRGEITVRISNVEDASKMVQTVFGS